jgi:hypothetical protein
MTFRTDQVMRAGSPAVSAKGNDQPMPSQKAKPNAPTPPTTTSLKVQVYETARPLLEAMLKDIKELAKKKPDARMSKANVTRINRLLTDLRECLTDEETMKYLDILDDDTLPQYSDGLIVMSQYQSALDAFRKRHYIQVGEEPGDFGIVTPVFRWSTP